MRVTCRRISDDDVAVSPSIAFQCKSSAGFPINLRAASPTRSAPYPYRDIDFYSASHDRARNLNADTNTASDCDLHACIHSDT